MVPRALWDLPLDSACLRSFQRFSVSLGFFSSAVGLSMFCFFFFRHEDTMISPSCSRDLSTLRILPCPKVSLFALGQRPVSVFPMLTLRVGVRWRLKVLDLWLPQAFCRSTRVVRAFLSHSDLLIVWADFSLRNPGLPFPFCHCVSRPKWRSVLLCFFPFCAVLSTSTRRWRFSLRRCLW